MLHNRLLPFTIFVSIAAHGQPLPLSPVRVVDLRPTALEALGRVSSSIEAIDVAENSTQWAAILRLPDQGKTLVVTGSDDGVHAFRLLDAVGNKIAIDAAGLVYITLSTKTASTDIQVLDPLLRASSLHTFPNKGMEPVSSSSEVLWRSRDSLYYLDATLPSRTLRFPGEKAEWRPPEIANEIRHVFGSVQQQQIELGTLSEEVVIRRADGTQVNKTSLSLDDAYRLTNHVPPARDPLSGESRMLWAGLSHDGALLICLSRLPISEPAQIAAIDPTTGKVIRVFSVQLPTLSERKDQYNPRGFIHPFHGAVGDRIIIMDSDGILAVYGNS